jgi:hypothetical protein
MQDDFTLVATANIMGSVKLYKLRETGESKEEEDAPSSQMAHFPPGPIQNNGGYSLEMVHEFNDHFFPINEVQFCPHSRTV